MNSTQNGKELCISKNLFEQAPQSGFFPLQMCYSVAHLYLTYMSKIVIGQKVISVFDYYVNKLEKTIEFCIPRENADDVAHNRPKTAKDVKNPMIWFLFLPSLIALRLFFFWSSVFSIILGKGEVTAKEVQLKVSDFRRYYRSVRYYAVKELSEEDLKTRESKRRALFLWRIIFVIDEMIFMRQAPMVCEDEMHEQHGPRGQTLASDSETVET